MGTLTDDLTLEELCEMRKDLQKALFTGAKKIKHNDRETEFHSPQQMQRALDQLDKQINLLSKNVPRTTITPTVTY